MKLRQKSVGKEHNHNSSKVIVVAVKASVEIIPKPPLVWALTHVAQHGDSIKLLLVLPSYPSGKGLWSLSKFTSECTHHRPNLGTSLDQKDDITDMCNKMMLELRDVYDPEKIIIKTKIVEGSPSGVVAAEVRRAQSNWVILDRRLKHEKKCCMEELQCNVVVMKRSEAKVLRLNLIESSYSEFEQAYQFPKGFRSANAVRGPPVTPTSSPDQGTSVTTTAGTSSISSCDPWASPLLVSEVSKKFIRSFNCVENWTYEESDLADSDSEHLSIHSSDRHVSKFMEKRSSQRSQEKARILNRDSLMVRGTNVREVTALSRKGNIY